MDPICLLRDSLWDLLYDVIDKTLASRDDTTVTLLTSTGIVGEDITTTLSKKLLNVRNNLQWQRRGHDKYVGHLMLDTMQSQKHFELRAKVTLPLLTHIHAHLTRTLTLASHYPRFRKNTCSSTATT